ncbi:MAG: hypothetical protein ACJA2M_000334 [Polaribacter sp.]|jgi:hypothetical protein
MSKITENIITKSYIPFLLKNTKDLLIEALETDDDDKNLIDFFINFENEVKMKREKLKIGEINSN